MSKKSDDIIDSNMQPTWNIPDYNPNGSANPKGDASYWRARAEKAEALLDVALGAITSVVACCTYGTEEQAKSGAYGISRDAFVKIDKFMRMYSETVKGDE